MNMLLIQQVQGDGGKDRTSSCVKSKLWHRKHAVWASLRDCKFVVWKGNCRLLDREDSVNTVAEAIVGKKI